MHLRRAALLPEADGSRRFCHSGLPQGKSSKAFSSVPRCAGQPRAITIGFPFRAGALSSLNTGFGDLEIWWSRFRRKKPAGFFHESSTACRSPWIRQSTHHSLRRPADSGTGGLCYRGRTDITWIPARMKRNSELLGDNSQCPANCPEPCGRLVGSRRIGCHDAGRAEHNLRDREHAGGSSPRPLPRQRPASDLSARREVGALVGDFSWKA